MHIVSISGEETAYPIETSGIVSWNGWVGREVDVGLLHLCTLNTLPVPCGIKMN